MASLSIGERALFQFVRSRRIGEREAPLVSQWLDDGSLQIFGGSFFKDRVFHRVQRVDKRARVSLPPSIENFETRRINFTFRFVPTAHVIPFSKLGPTARQDVRGYVEELAKSSTFFRNALNIPPVEPCAEADSRLQATMLGYGHREVVMGEAFLGFYVLALGLQRFRARR